MIDNLPTPEGLNEAALSTYFKACGELTAIISDFATYFPPSNESNAIEEWPEEWRSYLSASQADLQSVCSLIQQSMELGLKAKICSVSPYLLLLDTSVKLSTSPKSIDFSGLRTLDAVDLPGAVNTLTKFVISPQFVQKYADLRVLRNKITHLGDANVFLNPHEIFKDAIFIYICLWPDGNWLGDRLLHSSRRWGWLHDGKYTSTLMEVMQEWPLVVSLLTRGEFKSLFGHSKAERRYLCPYCLEGAETRYAGLNKLECGTAYLDPARKSISCILCLDTFATEDRECEYCGGGVICGGHHEWHGFCHQCGENVESSSGSEMWPTNTDDPFENG